MVLKREPTPAGPITDLFDRLHELHLDAGEPGVRQIATGIGRGVLSYTTVHNVFRGPKVPKWGHLELVVDQLGGNVEAFRSLWRAARLVELAMPAALQPDSMMTSTPDAERTHDSVSVPPPQPVRRDEGKDQQFEFVMVSNRLPARDGRDNATVRPSASRPIGAGTFLDELVIARRGVVVGWSGRPDDGDVWRTGDGMTLKSVALSNREAEWHYQGYCNSTLWPLYHDSIERPEFRREWRDAYRAVNQRFADTVARVAARGAVVWVQDYQLQLVPALLREQRPDLRIGFFLHIPLPAVELFTWLPERAEVLRGLLGADLIGFQRPRAVENFLRLCREVLGLAADAHSVNVDARTVFVDAFPISVDVTTIERLVKQSRIRRRAEQIRAELGNPETLLVGVDRLDYTKGIEQRLLAYGELLGSGQLSTDSVAFIQLANLSRERVSRYAHLRERVDRLAGHLNGSYGRMGKPAVHYMNQAVDRDEIMALYVAADVMVVTPLRDGMNLVAKEYVASRVDNHGVLVLSEFAGAAAELNEAIIINPNDLDDVKAAIMQAVALSPTEQAQRMQTMRRHLRTHDAQAWINSFLTRLDRSTPAGPRDLV